MGEKKSSLQPRRHYFSYCHHSLFICSSASHIPLLPVFSYFTAAHLDMLEPTCLSATATCHTPFIILICCFLFKSTTLSFWIPGLTYSSRSTCLSCITFTSHGSLYFPGTLKDQCVWVCPQNTKCSKIDSIFCAASAEFICRNTPYSVYFRISNSARGKPKEKEISSSRKHFRERCFWWEQNNFTILRTH